MSDFFIENIDYLLFIVGMGYIIFGGVCFVFNQNRNFPFSWKWLGFFGSFYGISQWLEIPTITSGFFLLKILQLVTLGLSLFFLLYFGFQGFKKKANYNSFRLLPFVIFFTSCFSILGGIAVLKATIGYSLALTGGILGTYIIFKSPQNVNPTGKQKWLFFLGILMLFFALTVGLLAPKASFWPASKFNLEAFHEITGFQVHLFIGIIGWLMMVCAWFILKTRSVSEKRLYPIFFAISTITILIGGWWVVKKTGNTRLSDETEQVLVAARLSASAMDVELIKKLNGTAGDIGTPQYVILKERLIDMRQAYPGFRFIYLMYQKGDSVLFYADSEPATSEDYSAPGDVFIGAPVELSKLFSGKWQQLTIIFTDDWGYWLSAFVPVVDKNTGKIIAILGIDRSMELIQANVSSDRLKIIFIIGLLMLLLVFFYIYNVFQYRAIDRIKESKNQLRVSEEKLRSLIGHLHAGVVVHDSDTRIILSNQQASALLGLSAEQLQGKAAIDPDWKFLRDDSSPMPLAEFPVNLVISSRQPVQNYIVGVVRPANHDRVWLLVNAFPEFFDNHEIKQIVVTFSDITELKQAEEALIESESLNRLVIENQGEGIGIVDSNEFFTFANPAADQMFGLPQGGLVGRNLLDFIVPGYHDVIHEESEKRAKSIKSTYELEIITETGAQRSLLVTATPKYNNKGIQSGTFGVFRDITDRKIAENALRESEERYKATFRTIPEAITITDENGTFIEVNEGFVALSGFSKEEVLGTTTQNLNIWTNPEDRTQIIDTVNHSGIIENLEVVFRNKSGTLLTTLVSACLINLNNRPHILSITRDITERKQMENDLIKAKENAEESDRLKSAFLANMSHEIRTPMNIILGFLPHLDDDTLATSERKQLISIIGRKGKELVTIFNDIIDISLIDSHQLTLTKTTFNLNELLDTLGLAFENEKVILEKTHIQISIQKPLSSGLSSIFTDEVRLSQILNNLIGNALKFTASGHIKFGYRIENENILFFVEDTGKGIAKEKHGIIWERFRQEEESNSRTFGGVGLGLSISKELVEMLGGKLWFTSEEENQAKGVTGGSTFYFTLPITVLVKNDLAVAEPEPEKTDFDFSKATILVADDVADNFEVIKLMLRRFKPTLIHAENGGEALQLCKTNPGISMVLMDVRMPVMDGIEATAAIKLIKPKLPIIAITAYTSLDDKARSMAAGCNNFITKPIDQKKLLKMIDHYLKME